MNLQTSEASALPGGFLTGLRVLELSEGAAAAFCGRLLADAGAGVILIEPPGGAPLRHSGPFAGNQPHPERSLRFLCHNAGKRSLVLDPARDGDRDRLRRLLDAADVLVQDLHPDALAAWGLDAASLGRASLIHARLSPFGREGPYRDFRAEELTLYALGGLMYHTGAYDREPLKHGPAQAAHVAGLNAAAGIVLALLARDRDGLGQTVDVAAQECLALMLGALELPQYAYTGGVARRDAKGGLSLNDIRPCADGYVVPVGFGAAWAMMAHQLDAPELLDERFATAAGRQRHAAELLALLLPRLAERKRYDLFHSAQALQLTWGVVQDPADLARCPQLAARGFWADVDHPVAGLLRLPGPPYRASRTPARVRGAAPLLGDEGSRVSGVGYREFDGGQSQASAGADANPERSWETVEGHPRPSTLSPRPSALPLADVRVIDSARVWAMPFASGLLCDMGAEVIKVEVPSYLDTRQTEPFLHNEAGERFWERSGIYNSLNRGKRGITLNLQTEEGRRRYRELVATADVLIENNRPGVMQRLGLDYAALREIRPDLIMLSNSGFGQTGPWRNYGAIALTLEPTTGLASFTGYAGGPPVRWNWFTDFPACWTAVFAVCGALHHRNLTGEGQHIDLAMYEVGGSFLGEELLDYSVNGHIRPRMGNRHPEQAPHGCYPCLGDDAWVTIAVTTDAEWQTLCRAMARPDLSADMRLATAPGRKAYEDAIDVALAAWTRGRDRYDVMRQLQAAGVASGVVQTTRDLYFDPQLAARSFFEWVDHGNRDPELGRRPYVSRAWRLSRTPGVIQGRAPGLGEHNRTVLGGLLGLDEATLARLAAVGAIGDAPAEGTPVPETAPPEERIAQGRWAAWDADFEQRLGIEPTATSIQPSAASHQLRIGSPNTDAYSVRGDRQADC